MSVLKWLGLGPNQREERLKNLVSHSYNSVRVVGRGTVKIDPKEIRNSSEFKRARGLAKNIVERQKTTA